MNRLLTVKRVLKGEKPMDDLCCGWWTSQHHLAHEGSRLVPVGTDPEQSSCLENPSCRSALEDSSGNDAVNRRRHQPGHLRGIVLKLSAHWLLTLHTTQHPCLVTSKMAQQTIPAHENENAFISQQTLYWVVVWYTCSSIIGGYIYLTWAYSFCKKKKTTTFEFYCFCPIQGSRCRPSNPFMIVAMNTTGDCIFPSWKVSSPGSNALSLFLFFPWTIL